MNKLLRLSILLIIPIILCSSCSETQATQTLKPVEEKIDLTEVKLENNDWSKIWIENANQSDKPRILFVGDSITDGYYNLVKESLSDEYYLAYYVTSKFINNPDLQTELTTILKRYNFEIIQVNNGLHGWDYSINEYQNGLKSLVGLLNEHAPESLFIWCLTTPVRHEENLDYLGKLNQDVTLRNQAALEILGKNDFLINDLYQGMLEHPEYYKEDGFHFNNKGKEAQAKLIVDFILASQ